MSYNPYGKYSLSWWKFWLIVPSDILDCIKRIWDYLPLLWEDRDWDHVYLLHMMRFKIRRMRDHMENHAIVAHSEDHVVEMAQADVLLRNVVDDDPDDEWLTHYYQWDVHIKAFADCKNQPEHMKALDKSIARVERNWRKVWRHLEKHARGW